MASIEPFIFSPDTVGLIETNFPAVEVGLENFWRSFSKRLNIEMEPAKKRAFELIFDNNLASAIIETPEYQQVYQKEKDLRGPCAIGASICIDGRLPIIPMFGRVVNVWGKMAGIIKVYKDKIDGRQELASGRLKESIIERAVSGEPLLEIMVAHTSKHDPDHGCGAMKKWQVAEINRLEATGQNKDAQNLAQADLVEENLKAFEPAIEAITDLYNRNVDPQKQLKTVAITAVYDTDSMGFTLGYGKDKQLFTTDLTKTLATDWGEDSKQENSNDLNSISNMVSLESKIADLAEILLMTESGTFLVQVNEYINSELSDLSLEQQQALQFILARNVAYQFITGCYKHQAQHPFVRHAESFQSISNDGPTVGQFLPNIQAFCASPEEPEEKIETITTQCQIMDTNKETELPHILFLSEVVAKGEEDRVSPRARVRDLWSLVIQDDGLVERIKAGNLIPVPVLINERTREVLEVVDAAA